MNATATQKRTRKQDPELGALPVLIEVDRLEPHPDNPRDDFSDNDPELVALVDSLQAVQLVQPITVEQIDAERYRIIAGERRWRAATLAGWKSIPCFVSRLSPAAAVRLMVDENLLRKNLNPIEQARAIELLTKPVSEGGAGLTKFAVSRARGASDSWASQQLMLLRLPKYWQDLVATGEVNTHQGKALVSYVDRPDVLAAVKADRKANPADWKSSAEFDRQLAEVVARLDGLAAGTAESASVSRDMNAPATLPLRRSAPVQHNAVRLIVDSIVALIEQLDTLEQLDQVTQAVRARGCLLRTTAAKK